MTRTTTTTTLLLALALIAAGCSLRGFIIGDAPALPIPATPSAVAPPPAPEPPPVPASSPESAAASAPAPASDPALDQLRTTAATLRGQLAATQAQIADRTAALGQARREAEQAPLRALCRWASYLGAAAAIAGIVLAGVVALASAWLPILRLIPLGWKSGALIAAAGALAFGASQALAASLPWIGAAALITLAVVIVALLAWSALTWKRGGIAMAGELQTYAEALTPDVRAHLDRFSRSRQGRLAAVGDHLLEVARGR